MDSTLVFIGENYDTIILWLKNKIYNIEKPGHQYE